MRQRPDLLQIDAQQEIAYIAAWIRRSLSRDLRRQGVVVGISGGVDSAATAALAVEALGADRVFGLLLPDRESDPDTLSFSRRLVDRLGIAHEHHDISQTLDSLGCYAARSRVVARLVPGADERTRFRIELTATAARFSYFSLVAEGSSGEVRVRLPAQEYLELVAATNLKQRLRKTIEYLHADRLNYAVAGTANRLEHDQGFFVKQGDGAADLKPIAHLYKTQVYRLAQALGVPAEILEREPTTDTYSLEQTQSEFYFSLPIWKMDLCLFGLNEGLPASEVAERADLSIDEVVSTFERIRRTRATTRYLHSPPRLARSVPEIDPQAPAPSDALTRRE